MVISPAQPKDSPKLFYEKIGAGRQHIILIHGFGLNHKSWYDISLALAEQSCIYMIDLIGFGESSAPENWPYTIQAQADILFEVIIDKNLLDVVIIGHSYGGGVGMMLLQKMIENQMGERIKKLILIAPAVYPQPLPFFLMIPCLPFVGKLLLKYLDAQFQIKLTLWKILENKKIITKEKIQQYTSNLETSSHRKALIKTAQHIIPEKTEDLLNKIEKIQHRILLIYGENDSVILKKNLERLSNTLPNIITKKIANCGHIPHEEYPTLVSGLMTDFLGHNH